MLADRYNPLRTGGVCLSLYAALMISSWFLLCNPATFGPILILHGVVSGSCMTLTASLQQRLPCRFFLSIQALQPDKAAFRQAFPQQRMF